MNTSHARGIHRLLNPLFVVLLLLILPGLPYPPASAAANLLYVSALDATCAGHTPCYTSLQSAVDAAANGDEIRVAAGTYDSPQARTGADGYSYKQVVFISKSLTIQGGYHPTTWSGPNPLANPTIIDAQKSGRGVTMLGNGSQQVTLAGLTIQNGDYTGLGNPEGISNQSCNSSSSDCGGGLFAKSVQIILKDSQLLNNIASTTRYSQGGGAYLWYTTSGSRVENTIFSGNQILAPGMGGFGAGLLAMFGDDLIVQNSIFSGNTSNDIGGGLAIHQLGGLALVEDCQFIGNTSTSGGGLHAGLTYNGLALEVKRSTFTANHSITHGAAIELIKWGGKPSSVELENLLIGGNTLATTSNDAGMLYIVGGSGARLDITANHLTFANHLSKTAIEIHQPYNQIVKAQFTNTLIDNAIYGWTGDENFDVINISHDHTLANDLLSLHFPRQGTPDFAYTNLVSGDPQLTSSYHLGVGSAAIDAGADLGVPEDVDGDHRPIGAGYDIGADEARLQLFLPLAIRR